MNLGLKNKTAIIGGSSSGIGRAIALALAEEGCKVVICGRDEKKLANAKNDIIAKYNAEILALKIDQTKIADIKKLVKETIKKFKRIDILVTNTGGPKAGGFFDFAEHDWREAFELLFLYVVRIYNEVLPIMKKQKFGRIVNNTSFTVKEPAENIILSNVYRTAVVSMAKTLSRELAKYNITINNICPGLVDTDRLRELFGAKAKNEGVSINKIYAQAISSMPILRLQKPEEIAGLVVFLSSERASSITGATIQADGGLLRGVF